MCWLNNRKPEQWKRNRDMMQTEDRDNNIVVNIIRNDDKDKEKWTANTNKTTAKAVQKVNAKKAEEDLDYWPDDWTDD